MTLLVGGRSAVADLAVLTRGRDAEARTALWASTLLKVHEAAIAIAAEEVWLRRMDATLNDPALRDDYPWNHPYRVGARADYRERLARQDDLLLLLGQHRQRLDGIWQAMDEAERRATGLDARLGKDSAWWHTFDVQAMALDNTGSL